MGGLLVSPGLWMETWVYQSSDILGSGGRGMFVMRGIRSIGDRVRFELKEVSRIGRDLRLIYSPSREGE